MSACDPNLFGNIDRPAFNRLIATLAKQYPNIDPSNVADTGQESGDGYTISWDFNEAAQTLTVQCLDSPWYAPCSAINEAIEEAVAAAAAQQPPTS